MHKCGTDGLVVLLIQLIVLAAALPAWTGAAIGPQQLPAGVSADWWTRAQAHIRRAEYQPSPVTTPDASNQPQILQAPNRAHNFRTTFAPEGVLVKPRTATDADWTWGLSLVAIGPPGDLRRPESARVRLSGSRVELVRGTLTEWYENDQRGLEQGFTLHEPPPGSTGAAELVLRMTVCGSLVASLDPDGATLAFAARDGQPRLHFGHLLAVDATGRKLPARFRLGGGNLDITVATTAAQYPLLIDPLATSPAWTAESDQAFAFFGGSVGTAGDVNNDGFADVIVGARGYDNGQDGEGRAYVFHGSAAGLNPIPNWTAESNQAGASFGSSVGTAGDVNGDGFADVIVGAPDFDGDVVDEGAVAVYFGSSTGLNQVAVQVRQPSNQAGANFGISVGTAGDVNRDGFADVIVGAYNYNNGQNEEGRAYVYLGSASGLGPTPNWTAESNQENAHFGISVGTAGDVNGDGYADVIVGAYDYDNGQNNEGAAAVYLGSAFGLSPTANWTAESDQASAYFGRSVGTAGDVNGDGFADVIVGAPYYDNGGFDEGRAFVFHGSASGLSPTPNWTAESDQYQSHFGTDVCTAGDVNRDGFADVIVGAPYYANGEDDEGRAFVYQGSASGLGPTPSWTAEPDQADTIFGGSVGTAGDVNGDGYADVIVGAAYFDNG